MNDIINYLLLFQVMHIIQGLKLLLIKEIVPSKVDDDDEARHDDDVMTKMVMSNKIESTTLK